MFVISAKEKIIKIIKGAFLRVSQNNKLRNNHAHKC